MDFAEKIYDLRQRAGLTQEELASRVGVTPGTYRSWESGRSRGPQFPFLAPLARGLGLSGRQWWKMLGEID